MGNTAKLILGVSALTLLCANAYSDGPHLTDVLVIGQPIPTPQNPGEFVFTSPGSASIDNQNSLAASSAQAADKAYENSVRHALVIEEKKRAKGSCIGSAHTPFTMCKRDVARINVANVASCQSLSDGASISVTLGAPGVASINITYTGAAQYQHCMDVSVAIDTAQLANCDAQLQTAVQVCNDLFD